LTQTVATDNYISPENDSN